MIRINQLNLPVHHKEDALLHKASRILKIPKQEIGSLQVARQSLDARKKPDLFYSYTVDITLAGDRDAGENQAGSVNKKHKLRETEIVKKARSSQVRLYVPGPYQFPGPGSRTLAHPPVIIGTGPAGLFCGYMLAKAGYCPVLLERGADVDQRTRKVNAFWDGEALDLQTNVQFGEGGAGTFSDGKLNTLVKDPAGRSQEVMRILAEHGADSRILYAHKPHVGTDVLSRVVKSMRREIVRLGGQVRFESLVTDVVIEHGRVKELIVEPSCGSARENISAEAVVLAVGHSARDTFEMLQKRGIPMEAKAFAVGLRIQHSQDMVDLSQYGALRREGTQAYGLDPASYKLTCQTSTGRGVYTFCMCPGGYVVNASSEPGRLAVNGMSYHDRSGPNANSALIVTVTPRDFPDASALGGIAYQRYLEERAWQYGAGAIPVQLYGDFKQGCPSSGFGDVSPQFKGTFQFASLHEMLPGDLTASLKEAIESFERNIHGFSAPDSILAGVESRTSSPVRIPRNEQFESGIMGLFPCGEGAGYAGGITSAAMDGIKVAEEIARRFQSII